MTDVFRDGDYERLERAKRRQRRLQAIMKLLAAIDELDGVFTTEQRAAAAELVRALMVEVDNE